MTSAAGTTTAGSTWNPSARWGIMRRGSRRRNERAAFDGCDRDDRIDGLRRADRHRMRGRCVCAGGDGDVMLDSGFYNMDCMEAMKQFTDGFFDLAIVDPPYGDGGQKIGGGTLRAAVRPLQASITSARIAESRMERGVTRTGGTWATKYAKKLLRGTSPRSSHTLMNCSASHVTRLSGGAITSIFHRQGISSSGVNSQ